MAFDPFIVEAKLALDLISSDAMPALACDALEAGLDGPAIRRMAALISPTYFELQEVLPHAMEEMRLGKLDKRKAAFRLAKLRAQEILKTNSNPFEHLGDFEHLWHECDYWSGLLDCGNLEDEVYVARYYMGSSEEEIRARLLKTLTNLASAEEPE